MSVKIKPLWGVIPVIVALGLASCSPTPARIETEKTSTAISVQPFLKTTMGDFVIASVSLVDEVHEQKAQPGQKFLLIGLTRDGSRNLVPGDFSLEAFQKMIQEGSGNIYVSGADGSRSISTMAGWVQDEFSMGFTVPIVGSYALYWPGNSPIELHPKGQ